MKSMQLTHFLLRCHDIIILTSKVPPPMSPASNIRFPQRLLAPFFCYFLCLSTSSSQPSSTVCSTSSCPPLPPLPPPHPPPIKEKHVGCELLLVGLDFSGSDLKSQHV
ncbi:hypothetical protein EYF80_064305 [Liparis tanakae]|uniref:Uncharacterized protein n=1 Tax=Liparis tanakae TaxID=230148 RepID=A0A4Z2EAJ9_9TELE|nr:hypothetical protein EYF80_064305 [Liparis tanakae]